MKRFCVALVSSALLLGCGATDDRPAVWEYISPAIFQPNCATVSCHSPAAAAAGLDFSDADRGYTSLTGLWVWIVDPTGTEENGCRTVDGTVVCQRGRRPLLIPYDPAQSRVVNMLRARGAARMPPDRPLPEADIRLVEAWIRNGAAKVAGANSDGAAPGALDDAATVGLTGGATDGPADGPTDGARDDGRDGMSDGAGAS